MFSRSNSFGRALSRLSHVLAAWFPTPEFLLPRAAGIDISDSSIKWLVLERATCGFEVRSYGEVALTPGIVVSGAVRDSSGLATALSAVRRQLEGVHVAHAALPEEAAYVFDMIVPHGTPRAQILRMIEFEFENRVPIPPSAAVYDYTEIPSAEHSEHRGIGVTVFPRELASAYADAFDAAGITLLSLEVEARSIARAVCGNAGDPITLIADFGRARTGFAVVNRGVPIFTTTVDVGGDLVTRALIEKAKIPEKDVEHFKNEEGLLADKKRTVELEAVSATASALTDEVARNFHYWDTRRNEAGERVTPVGQVILVGGSANLNGLADYIAARVQAPCTIGNIWRNIADLDEYLPPIPFRTSLQYATAAGLALRAL